MIRIGIVSENYRHDSRALKALLESKYDKSEVLFIPILKTVAGKQLNRVAKVLRQIQLEAKQKRLDFILFVRDLDGLPSEKKKIDEQQNWFNNFRFYAKSENLFFLLIFELEALILADISTFNKLYQTNIKFSKDPLWQATPKEFLYMETKNTKKPYSESHIPQIFSQLNFNTIYQNHQGDISFQSFIDELNDYL